MPRILKMRGIYTSPPSMFQRSVWEREITTFSPDTATPNKCGLPHAARALHRNIANHNPNTILIIDKNMPKKCLLCKK
jgi:hypothetical protein